MTFLEVPLLAKFTELGHGFGTCTTDTTAILARAPRIKQVHGATVICASRHRKSAAEIPLADALVSNEPGVTLAIQTADCLPVLFYDPAHRVTGAAHAGWLGVTAGVLERTLEAMVQNYDVSPATVHVALGPAIGPCCFEVGADVRDAFVARQSELEKYFATNPRGRWMLDLQGAARWELEHCGIPRNQIDAIGACTHCDAARFYSYRRQGAQAGRQWSFVALHENTFTPAITS